MMNLVVVFVTSFLLAGTEAHFRPCLIHYSDGSQKIMDCYPSNLFSCEEVNLTVSAKNEPFGDSEKPVDHEEATIVGLYLCKPRPCVDPSSLAENQTAFECRNASDTSECVPAAYSVGADAMDEVQENECARPVSSGHFEDLSKDPDIHFRCTIPPEVVLAQLSCKVQSVVNGTVLSERDCIKGTKTCNQEAFCRVNINDEEVDLYFCNEQ